MDEDYIDYDYNDILSERAKALCMVAQVLDSVSNKESMSELLTMMKKINLSINLGSTAEIHAMPGGKQVSGG